MKKKNLAATLAIIAISAIPLMAQQVNSGISVKLLTTPLGLTAPASINQEEIRQAMQQAVQDGVQNFRLSQNRGAADAAIETLKTLLNNEEFTVSVAEQTDPTRRYYVEQSVRQDVFTTIDDLASEILNLPEEEQISKVNEVRKTLKENKFAYLDKHVTLQELFDFSAERIYYDGNMAIVKFLNKKFQCEHYNFHPTLVLGIDSGNKIEWFENKINNICPDVTILESDLRAVIHYADVNGRQDIVKFMSDKQYLINAEWQYKKGMTIQMGNKDTKTKTKTTDDKSPWWRGFIKQAQQEK